MLVPSKFTHGEPHGKEITVISAFRTERSNLDQRKQRVLDR